MRVGGAEPNDGNSSRPSIPTALYRFNRRFRVMILDFTTQMRKGDPTDEEPS